MRPDIHVSHNHTYGAAFEVDAFDPRRGYDAFRYQGSPGDPAAWEATMTQCGMSEADVSESVMERILAMRDGKF